MNLDNLLINVEKPSRYTGGEFNTPDMTKPCKVRYCLCFIDVYEVAMSNLGIQLIYHNLNEDKDIVCERCFAPWTDFGKLLRENDIPLMSIETRKPLKDFDILGFSIQYELSYTNILYMLDLAKIPYYSKDRDETYPLLVAGGPTSANPEPYADFFDIVMIGEGEEVNGEICKIFDECRGDKRKILEECSKLQGVYVPAFATLKNYCPQTKVTKRIVDDLNRPVYPIKPLVPNLEPIHDRPILELFRGCYAACRFCQACFFYRPIRYREADKIIEIANELMKSTGCDEMGMCSLSSGDYDGIYKVIETLLPITQSKNISLQLPSLRLDSYTAELTKSTRKSSLTFAPEAGTQRLRDVINKNISDANIQSTMQMAFKEGYKTVKLYFMIGLPTETEADLCGIVDMVKKIKHIYFETVAKKNLTITVSTAVFIPKPLTPFQWARQISFDEMLEKQNYLKAEFRKMKNVNYNYHGADTSMLEGIFARGDRRLSKLVEVAYSKGCVFDGWSELFKFDKWMEAIKESKTDSAHYLREIPLDEELCWDFIDIGTTKSYFIREWIKAQEGIPEEGCFKSCKGCGANRLGACRLQTGEKI